MYPRRKRGRPSKKRIMRRNRRMSIAKSVKYRQPVQFFKRKAQLATIQSEVAGNGLGYSFALTDVPSYQDFIDLYDQFMLAAVKIEFIPSWTTASYSGTGAIGTNRALPEVVSAIDYNDITSPTAGSDLFQYESCRITRGNRVHKRYLKPKFIVDQTYTSKETRGYMATEFGGNPNNVAHYGLKVWINGTAVQKEVTYTVYCTYYFKMKTVK